MVNPYQAPKEEGWLRKSKFVLWRLATVAALVVVGLMLAAALALPPSRSAPQAARRIGCMSQLRQIMLAIRNYEAEHGQLPPAYTVDADGKPLHSWRTLILPYMEETALYEKIDLSRPWDDPANELARESCPDAYRCPGAELEEGKTTYLAVVDTQSVMAGSIQRKMSDVTDGAARTMVLIDAPARQAVHWMSPVDTGIESMTGPAMDGVMSHRGVIPVAFLDVHVKAMSVQDLVKHCRTMMTIAGGDDVDEW